MELGKKTDFQAEMLLKCSEPKDGGTGLMHCVKITSGNLQFAVFYFDFPRATKTSFEKVTPLQTCEPGEEHMVSLIRSRAFFAQAHEVSSCHHEHLCWIFAHFCLMSSFLSFNLYSSRSSVLRALGV